MRGSALPSKLVGMEKILEILYPFLASVFAAIIALLARKVAAAITTHVEAGETRTFLLRLNDIVADVVGELAQTMVGDLKAETADGKLTPADITRLRTRALNRVIDFLGVDGNRIAERVFKTDSQGLVRIIETKIEAAVARSK